MSDRDDISMAWKLAPSTYMEQRPPEYTLPSQPFSCYVTMRDGIQIAVDVYTPQSLQKRADAPTKFPTIMVATP